jgi:hypothetical protein
VRFWERLGYPFLEALANAIVYVILAGLAAAVTALLYWLFK